MALYRRWEEHHWQADAVDVSRDRHDWMSLSDDGRREWYWLAGFSHFRASEIEAVLVLSRLLPCFERSDQRCYLGTQIADEARHAYFFQRYHDEVLEAAPLVSGPSSPSASYQDLFFNITRELTDRAAASPRDRSALVEAVVHFFIILEGALAMATLSTIRRVLERTDLFPGLRRGLIFAQRDEVRHVQFGVATLDELFAANPEARDAADAHLTRVLPILGKVLEPQRERAAALSALGLDPLQRRTDAFAQLDHHLRQVGLSTRAATTGAVF
jgi:ribonucleoside-diphosphate reductase beta chain